MKRFLFVVLVGLILFSACAAKRENPVTEVLRVVYVTATPKPTATATSTPSPTPTSTPTLTPTPTAIPASISGNPRAYQRLDPVPSNFAVCGYVDTLDFPLDPPDGEDARGGGDFGVYRDRYDKFHAGEDWGYNTGSNFGKSVYSIGHGQVTFAEPNGWGVDKGTIVIRHILPDGGYILSFYGHLDPPSVELNVGDCVERGDKIAEIGRPRTPPHLHFEIRLHLPNSTGHGYWSIDPTLAGWLPPSQTIWEYRVTHSPGVLWGRGYAEGVTIGLGEKQDSLLLIQDENLIGLGMEDGNIQWSQVISDTVRNAALDSTVAQAYILDLYGKITALPIPDPEQPNWTTDIGLLSNANLIPIPGGGLIAVDRRRMAAVNTDGEIQWELDLSAELVDWVFREDTFVFTTTEDQLWSVEDSKPTTWDMNITGKLTIAGGQVYLYTGNAIYALDVDKQTGLPVVQLPEGFLHFGDLAPLPNGGVLLYHVDGDHRLIAIRPDGSFQWERSIREDFSGDVQLVFLNDTPYLLLADTHSSGNDVKLYAIDPETAQLTHLFTGGSRSRYTRNTWAFPIEDHILLINIGEGPLAVLDPQAALRIISTP